ncbi:hypothetical protein N1I87_02235 [Bacillus sp. FSL W8-0102]|uniref:hypothetical protein n=1 Tax=Bacillus sp. FSL W8-0102 TaxID=2978205 RepID=UPI0030F8BC2F
MLANCSRSSGRIGLFESIDQDDDYFSVFFERNQKTAATVENKIAANPKILAISLHSPSFLTDGKRNFLMEQ